MKRILIIIIALLSLTSCNNEKRIYISLPENAYVTFMLSDIDYTLRVISSDNQRLKLSVVKPENLNGLIIEVDNDNVFFSDDDISFEYKLGQISDNLRLLYYVYNLSLNEYKQIISDKVIYDDIYNTVLKLDKNKKVVQINISSLSFKIKGDEKIEGVNA